VFCHWLPDLDDNFLLSGRLSNSLFGSAMKRRLVILTVVLLGWTAPALSQGCAMCYSSARANSSEGQRIINKAVIVLLIPPAGFMTVGIWMAQRYAKKRDEEQSTIEEFFESAKRWE